MRDRLREDPLPCPNCHSNLVELERSDVLIDACPKCRGVWLDRGELDRILDRERRVTAGVADDDQDFLRELGGRRSDTRSETAGARAAGRRSRGLAGHGPSATVLGPRRSRSRS